MNDSNRSSQARTHYFQSRRFYLVFSLGFHFLGGRASYAVVGPSPMSPENPVGANILPPWSNTRSMSRTKARTSSVFRSSFLLMCSRCSIMLLTLVRRSSSVDSTSLSSYSSAATSSMVHCEWSVQVVAVWSRASVSSSLRRMWRAVEDAAGDSCVGVMRSCDLYGTERGRRGQSYSCAVRHACSLRGVKNDSFGCSRANPFVTHRSTHAPWAGQRPAETPEMPKPKPARGKG